MESINNYQLVVNNTDELSKDQSQAKKSFIGYSRSVLKSSDFKVAVA